MGLRRVAPTITIIVGISPSSDAGPRSFNATDKILEYTTVCTVSLTIIPIVQATKFQKDRCLRMMEDIHQLLYALMGLSIRSDDIRSPKTLEKLAHTLQKFSVCLTAQRELGTIKRLFKQNELTAQLDSCEAELKEALQIFTWDPELESRAFSWNSRVDQLITHLRFITVTHFVWLQLWFSFSTPSLPKNLHGRDSELKDIVDVLLCEPARAAVLGPGGIGKTSLAMAAVHHPAIIEKYGLMHFISCESASTCAELVTCIGLYLGMETSTQLSKQIVRHFGQCGHVWLYLIILKPHGNQWNLENRLSNFCPCWQIFQALPYWLVTMRGAERPGKVKWNRPFLPPLEPLPPSASRQIFVEVADEPGNEEGSALDELLDLSGSLPLAVSLMATIASFEGYSNTPRLSSSPHAKNLISLLSLLPDGIRPEIILAGKVPIPNVRQCQSVLVATSLAYIDVKGHLKALSPIREYIRRACPPSPGLSRPLRTYLQDLLQVWKFNQLLSGNLATELVRHLGNIHELILDGLLTEEKSAWIAMGDAIVTLDSLSSIMLKGGTPLLQKLPHLIEATGDSALRWKYVGRMFVKGLQIIRSLVPMF
ncbi:hypothetical protein B0H13DRAFT_2311628 [Mycena leptocephala]|nr:hypothetical protein B0H13DRAFT_2311628 [Mycena leptocephala]